MNLETKVFGENHIPLPLLHHKLQTDSHGVEPLDVLFKKPANNGLNFQLRFLLFYFVIISLFNTTTETLRTRKYFVESLIKCLYMNLKTGQEIIKSNNKIYIKHVY